MSNGNDLYVRRDVYALNPDGPDVAALRTGIAAMQARPVTDPTSWLFQADIHGTDDPIPADASEAAGATWSTCQHGSFFFLSWHRARLLGNRNLHCLTGTMPSRPSVRCPSFSASRPTPPIRCTSRRGGRAIPISTAATTCRRRLPMRRMLFPSLTSRHLAAPA